MQQNINRRPVEVRPPQVPHFQRIVEILKHEYGYLDVSTMGAGKTHITCAVAASFKLNMLVVCPKTAKSNWTKWSQIYGIHLFGVMTYQSLRGQEGRPLNHGLLVRNGEEYQATDLFEQCVKSKMLLVFDEYHNLKNDNTQLASAHAMVKSLVRLVRMGYQARIALLSGTPCVEKENVTSTFKMLGVILSDNLYNYNRSAKKYELIGLQEAIDKCNSYDRSETFMITCKPVNKTTAKTMCYDLYTRVLKRFVVSSMPPPVINFEKDEKNYYILMPAHDVERLKKGLLLFKSATNYRHEVQEVDMSGVNWGDVTTSRMEIDAAKIDSVCRLTIQDLTEDLHCKVLIYCNYKDDMRRAAQILSNYRPMIMDGSTNDKQRDQIVAAFQADNDDYRILITNPKVGGVSIDLDDKHGGHSRITNILPSYFFTDQVQAAARTHREGTKSKSKIRFIYSRAFPYETGILHSMAMKSEVLRNMITHHHIGKFPGEYQELLEYTPEEVANGIKVTIDIKTIIETSNAPTINITPKVGHVINPNTIPALPSMNNQTEPKEEKQNNQNVPKEEKQAEVNEVNAMSKVQKIWNYLDKKMRDPLEEDKYHAYSLYLEIKQKDPEAVPKACKLMNDNVTLRLNENMKTISFITKFDTYRTEDDLITFIEAFNV